MHENRLESGNEMKEFENLSKMGDVHENEGKEKRTRCCSGGQQQIIISVGNSSFLWQCPIWISFRTLIDAFSSVP
jgi:hypothetical protein